MRHLKYEDEKVVAIETYIKDLQKDIDDLEWEGQHKKAENLKFDANKHTCEYGSIFFPCLCLS